jgi:hypothetical protein
MSVATRPVNPPMLFAFRGVQVFQLLLAVAALATGVGATFLIKAYTDGGSPLLVLAAVVLGLLFLWMFGAALKAPTSLIAITEERTRIRFATFVDTVVSTDTIVGARVVHRNIFGGVGVRTNFSGDVAIVSTWGDVVELTLNRPVRIWLIPKLIPLKAYRLTVSVRNPAKLAERFGPVTNTPVGPGGGTRKTRKRGSRTR